MTLNCKNNSVDSPARYALMFACEMSSLCATGALSPRAAHCRLVYSTANKSQPLKVQITNKSMSQSPKRGSPTRQNRKPSRVDHVYCARKEAEGILDTAPCMGDLQGKVAIVTGASAGIGKQCAVALAAAGMKVVACARRKQKLEEFMTAALAEGAKEESLMTAQCDVQKEADIKDVIKSIEDTWNLPPAVLINNAGLSLEDTTMLEGSTSSWQEMMNTNVIAVAVFSREAVAAMRKHKSYGHIVNISSMSAYRIPKFAGGGFYAATKHALRCISDGTRIEAQQQGIPLRVSCVSPGVVHTDFYQVRHKGNRVAAAEAVNYEALEARNVVQAVLYAVSAPKQVCVDDIVLRSLEQPL